MLKKHLSVCLLMILLGGLFWSRALLSLTLLSWALFALYQVVKNDRSILKNPLFIWSICPLFIWLLGAWQDPFSKTNFDYLITLSAYPATILIVHTSPKKEVTDLWIKIWLSATLIAISYPLFWYFKDSNAAQIAYGKGQSLPTFMDTDHVRFSIFLCSSLLFILYAKLIGKIYKLVFGLILFVLILFLSVRTGWVLAICIIGIFAIAQFFQTEQKKIMQLMIGAFLMLLLLSVSYFIFPNIQQKIAYSNWEWNQLKPGVYNANFSDGTRRDLNYISWKLIETNYAINTGWQGIPAAINASFNHYFKTNTLSYGWPFNQWLFWWIGSGWWGMLLFSGWLFYPTVWGFRKKNIAIISWSTAIALSCFVETTLNYQYGVLLHVFPIALLCKGFVISEGDNS